MKTKFGLFISLILLIIVSCSFDLTSHYVTGKGPVVSEKRNISKFSKIQISVASNVSFTQSENISFEIKGQKNILDLIKTYVDGDELIIETKDNNSFKSYERLEIIISGPDLNAVQIAGSSRFTAAGSVKTNKLHLEVSGSGNINFTDVMVEDVVSKVAGSGGINLSSKSTCNMIEISVAGSGEVTTQNVKAENVKVDLAGSGECKVFANSRLDVDIAGSGSVYYSGNAVVNSEVAGSGRVRKI